MKRERPKVVRHAGLGIKVVCKLRSLLGVEIAEGPVDGQQRDFGLCVDGLLQNCFGVRSIAAVVNAHIAKIKDESKRVGAEIAMIRCGDDELEFAKILRLALVQHMKRSPWERPLQR